MGRSRGSPVGGRKTSTPVNSSRAQTPSFVARPSRISEITSLTSSSGGSVSGYSPSASKVSQSVEHSSRSAQSPAPGLTASPVAHYLSAWLFAVLPASVSIDEANANLPQPREEGGGETIWISGSDLYRYVKLQLDRASLDYELRNPAFKRGHHRRMLRVSEPAVSVGDTVYVNLFGEILGQLELQISCSNIPTIFWLSQSSHTCFPQPVQCGPQRSEITCTVRSIHTVHPRNCTHLWIQCMSL